MEASNRLKQAQHFSTCRKVQNGNSRVHQDLPDSRVMGIVDRPIGHLPSHPHPPNSRKYPRFCHRSHMFQFTSLRTSHSPQVFTMIVKEVKLIALLRGLRLHQYLDDWVVPVSGRSRSEHSDSGRSNPVLAVENKSDENLN